VESFGGDEFFENALKDAFPELGVGQLLRSCKQALEEGAGFGELGFNFGAFCVAEVDADAGLSGVAGVAGDASEEFGPGGQRPAVPSNYCSTKPLSTPHRSSEPCSRPLAGRRTR
jgi:hypothetical protein